MPPTFSPPMKWLKPPIFLLGLVPLVILLLQAFHDQLGADSLLAALHLHPDLGANPIERITHTTGDWILIFLCITLAITPLRRILSQPWLIKFRRMFGLFAFFYATLHFLTYIWLDQFFAWSSIVKDVAKRPFITAGFTAFVLLIPLALTSTTGWIRRLGGKRWQLLHRLIYVSATAGVVHYYWLVKSDVRLPLLYAAIVTLLLGFRVFIALRKRSSQPLPDPAQAHAGAPPAAPAKDV
jgi:methionine sulfoxide reductase heme-binding subunit